MKRFLLCFALSLTVLVTAKQASAVLIIDFTGGHAESPVGDTTGGWEFNVSSTIIVDAIGLWDEGGDGFASDHAAGLWNFDGSVLLASSVITNASTPVASTSPNGRWLFNDIVPVVLTPGNYVVGQTFLNADPDKARIQPDATTIPEITFVRARQHAFSSALTFPEQTRPPRDDDGIFGPNLRLVQITQTPEPSVLLLFGGGLIGLTLYIRRR